MRLHHFCLGALLAIAGPWPLSHADDLGDLFSDYKRALQTGDAEEVAGAAALVYEYAAANLPESSKSRIAATINYGKALSQRGQFEQAEKLLSSSVDMLEKIHGEGGIELVDPLLEQVKNRLRQKRKTKDRGIVYRRLAHRALKITRDTRGEGSLLYGVVNLELGRAALDQIGDLYAKKYLKTAHRLFARLPEAEGYYRSMSDFYLGKYHLSANQYGSALPYLESALVQVDRGEQPDGQLELTTRAFLVEAYEEVGAQEKSIEQCRAIGKARPFGPDQDPQPLFRRTPVYPQQALRAGQQGYAVVRFTISDTGMPTDIETVEWQGSEHFGRAAEAYIEKLRYAPAFENGKPVDTLGHQTKVSFNIAR
ncbi:energy transducer TonB [Microbulbifer guangxiensis]|uniref:energy transducer TonB n=1 Tax=Microbulbifer guangxiensis TaxID=2904249 RepID=UPI001F316E5F|nr:energy transducer TonB [Microbulbifer guangxiensis]